MCGRIGQEQSASAIAQLFQAELLPGRQYDLGPRFNVAPTQPLLAVVSHEGTRWVVEHRWGLVPSWAKEPRAFGAKTINARAETVAVKPAFRESFRRRRSIGPVDLFYEWKRTDGSRQPYAIVRRDGKPLALDGLWSAWQKPEGDTRLLTCAVITTGANELVGELHDRMPVVLPEDAWDLHQVTSSPPRQPRVSPPGRYACSHPIPSPSSCSHPSVPALLEAHSKGVASRMPQWYIETCHSPTLFVQLPSPCPTTLPLASLHGLLLSRWPPVVVGPLRPGGMDEAGPQRCPGFRAPLCVWGVSAGVVLGIRGSAIRGSLYLG